MQQYHFFCHQRRNGLLRGGVCRGVLTIAGHSKTNPGWTVESMGLKALNVYIKFFLPARFISFPGCLRVPECIKCTARDFWERAHTGQSQLI